jgi:hypothetical protein
MINNIQVSPYSFEEYDPYYKQLIIIGYYLQYLVRYYGWEYKKLPLHGLSSVIFDGYSPTYCTASGNVWFDHPIVSYASCYTPKQIDKFHLRDMKKPTKLDWKEYEKNNRMCLRLSPSLYNEVLNKYPSLKKYRNKGIVNVNENGSLSGYDESDESFQEINPEDVLERSNEKVSGVLDSAIHGKLPSAKRKEKAQYAALFQSS